MATIKSCTDLPQSKKLKEFLPLESADMTYSALVEGMRDKVSIKGWEVSVDLDIAIKENLFSYRNGYMFPCWSLAALLEVLPRFIEFKGDKYYLRFMKEYVEYANDEISITGRYLHTTGNDNLVDACYEMIIKLHEQKLL